MKNFIAFLLFAGAAAGWYFYQQQSTVQNELAELKQSLPAYENTLASRKAEFQAFTRLLEGMQKVQARQNEIAAVQGKERKLKETMNTLTRERSEIIAKARQSFVGRIIPELTLTDGRKLLQLRVLKVEDSGLSISLPSGIQKLQPSELLEDLRNALHYQK